MAIGAMSWRRAYSMKSAALAGGSRRRRQAVGLSLKICSAVAPICRARRMAGIRRRATPRWMPTRGAPSGQLRRRRGSARASVRPMAPEPDQPQRGADLLTIGLLVFFVSLLVVVAALLTLPAILG